MNTTVEAIRREVSEMLRELPFTTKVCLKSNDEALGYKVYAIMEHGGKTFTAGFSVDLVEFMKCPHILSVKSKALRRILEHSWAKITAGDFSFDVEYPLEHAIADALRELEVK